MGGDRAYLSVVDWPSGWGEGRCVEALVMAGGLDPGQTELAVRRGVPGVVAMVDAVIAGEIVRALRDMGVMAFAPTRAQIRGWVDPVRVKALHLFPGKTALGVEPWRGESFVVQTADIRLIVHGTEKTTKTTVRDNPDGLRGATSAFDVAQRYANEDLVTREQSTRESFLIDLYAAVAGSDGSSSIVRARVDADKMNFGVLGEDKGITDRENTAKLAALLKRAAPGATADEGFGRFEIPPSVRARSGGSVRTAAFDFYSAWVGLLYRDLGAL